MLPGPRAPRSVDAQFTFFLSFLAGYNELHLQAAPLVSRMKETVFLFLAFRLQLRAYLNDF